MKLRLVLSMCTLLVSQAKGASKTTHAPSWNGSVYSVNSNLQYDTDQKALANLSLTGNESILDLGCGDGAISALIASRVPSGRVVGSDCAPAMIEFAQKTYAPLYPNISFTTSYAEDISYQNEFDIVTSFCMLHWVGDLQAVLNKIYRAVKPGGKILLFFPVVANNVWRSQLQATMDQPKWKSILKNMPIEGSNPGTTEYFESACTQAGFISCSAQVEIIPYTFETIDTFKSWFKALAWIKAVPQEHQEAFLNDFVQRILAYHPSQNNTCTIYPAYATIQAKKSS